MGKIEKSLATQIRRTKINSAIIATVAVAGVLAVGAVAPNVLGALGSTQFMQKRTQRIKSSFSRLMHAGYIVLEEAHGKKQVRLTKKGEWFAAQIGEGSLIPKKPKHWDGKWRMLIFDIPETRKKSREKIRLTLTTLGFVRLQDSVWVYPYDCEDFINVLKVDLRLGKDVIYVIADRVGNDEHLREQFLLKGQ